MYIIKSGRPSDQLPSRFLPHLWFQLRESWFVFPSDRFPSFSRLNSPHSREYAPSPANEARFAGQHRSELVRGHPTTINLIPFAERGLQDLPTILVADPQITPVNLRRLPPCRTRQPFEPECDIRAVGNDPQRQFITRAGRISCPTEKPKQRPPALNGRGGAW